MQPYTGELRNIEDLAERLQAIKEGFEPVPKHLDRAARLKLKGKKTAMVSLTSGGKLSKYAASLRKGNAAYLQKKKKRKAAKAILRASRHQK